MPKRVESTLSAERELYYENLEKNEDSSPDDEGSSSDDGEDEDDEVDETESTLSAQREPYYENLEKSEGSSSDDGEDEDDEVDETVVVPKRKVPPQDGLDHNAPNYTRTGNQINPLYRKPIETQPEWRHQQRKRARRHAATVAIAAKEDWELMSYTSEDEKVLEEAFMEVRTPSTHCIQFKYHK